MGRDEVARNYNIVALEEIAKKLPSDADRKRLYETAESLMHVAAGKAVLIGAFGTISTMPFGNIESNEKSTKEHSEGLDEWTNYLAEQAQKYISKQAPR